MSERNCRNTCPVKLLMGIEAKATIGHQGSESPTDLQLGFGLAGALLSGRSSLDDLFNKGLRYTGQQRYATNQCPMRDVSGPQWQPSERCADESRSIAARLAPYEGNLGPAEVARLGEIGLGPDLRQIGPAQG